MSEIDKLPLKVKHNRLPTSLGMEENGYVGDGSEKLSDFSYFLKR